MAAAARAHEAKNLPRPVRRSLVAELVQHALAVAPVLLDLDVELQEAKAAAEAETAAAAENTAPVQEGNDEQTH